MKTFIRAITITIVLALFATGSINPVAAMQVTLPNQPSESVAVATSHSPENEALTRLQTVLSATMQGTSGGKVLVIPTAQLEPQQMATLMEDMTVMCRIFDKKLGQSNLRSMRSMYGVTLPGHISMSMGSDSPEAMYIQGYGALFKTTVDFLLSPSPEKEKKEETEEEEADPVWKQMRQEIFSPQQAVKRPPNRPEEKYDPEKVENLKSTLIKSLVHAANIRGLNPDESVIITVTGKAGPRVVGMRGGGMYYGGNEDPKIISKEDLVSSQMVLVIRAKKSDIDAFAQNQIDINEFKEKVKVILQPSLSGNFSQSPSPFLLRGSGYSVPSSSSQSTRQGNGGTNRSSSRGSSGRSGGSSSINR
jgi:hypothetical protein